MAKVRGASFLGTLDYVRSAFGEEALERVLAALEPKARDCLGEDGRALFPAAWYEARTLSDLTRTLDRVLGTGDLALARAIGKHVAFADVNRFFKWLLRLTGPKVLFPRGASVWNNYYDGGRYVVEDIGRGHAALRIEEWDGADDVLCKRLEGWMERAVELAIGQHLHAVIRETHHCARNPAVGTGAFCRFEARWDE